MHLQMFLEKLTTTIMMMILGLSRTVETRLARNYETSSSVRKLTFLLFLNRNLKDITKTHIEGQKFNFDKTHRRGPEHWSDFYPDCGGQDQSPIDIVTHDVKCDNNLTEFVYNGYDTVPDGTFTVIHFDKWQGVIFEADNIPVSIQSNWFSSEYNFYGVYVWTGSVHEIDERTFPLQVGIFHWNSHKYNSIVEAEKQKDGVIILNILVDVDDSLSSASSNKAFSDAFDDIVNRVSKNVSDLSFPLASLLPPNNWIYYKYHGSYPEPPCHESIYWAVFEEPMYIKQEQMDHYITVFTSMAHPAKYVGRTAQPLNERFVSKYCS